ncbi:MAG: hypothetical protein LBM75_05470, partial [Myxococcales bacterium]|nr:hypothetical protein [Myxococcales bacterium]
YKKKSRIPFGSIIDALMLFPPGENIEGQAIYSIDSWFTVACTCRHIHRSGVAAPQPFPLGKLMPSEIQSSKSGSFHNPDSILSTGDWSNPLGGIISILTGSSHSSGNHSLDMDSVLEFERFNIAKGGLQNQPALYKSISKDLSTNEQGGKQPWDIFDSGKFSGHIFGKTTHDTTVQLATVEKAISLSKALVYYHHPGYWKEPPNFWNPYWRAKLHPWEKTEFGEVVLMSGSGITSASMGVTIPKAFSENE